MSDIADYVDTLNADICKARQVLQQAQEELAKLRSKHMKAVTAFDKNGASYILSFNGRDINARPIKAEMGEAWRVTEKGKGVLAANFYGDLGNLRFYIAIGKI